MLKTHDSTTKPTMTATMVIPITTEIGVDGRSGPVFIVDMSMDRTLVDPAVELVAVALD